MGINILVCAGHTLEGKGTGAVGYINESNENRILAKKIVNILNSQSNVTADYYEINKADNYLQLQVASANKKNYDLVVQVHFNANSNTISKMGTETLYSSNRGKVYAEMVTNKLGQMYKQRGSKIRDNLYWLNNTKAAAILIETCFVDSKADTDTYIMNKDITARLICEGILNTTIKDSNITTHTKKYKNCVLYGNDVDRVGAEIIAWYKDDCIFKHVKDHIKWEATNLFVVGGDAEKAMKALNNGEKYGTVLGKDRAETIRKCLEFVGK